jgi:FAD/FMN-containing dehydrogenase
MNTDMHTLLSALQAAVGPAHVLQGDGLTAYERDWRKRWHGRAYAVVRPGSTDEVAAVLRVCARHGVEVVPQGGNTGLVGSSVPDGSGTQVLLNLGRLNRVRAIDAANLTMTVEAGCILQAAQEAADAAGLLLPLSLAAEGSCTLGGNLSTNAGGTQVLRYGNARELCLGLEVVTPAGEVWDGLSGLRKDNTGYDLRHLYIGSEGTLGVITAAVMRLYPQPAASMTALAACDSVDQCVALLQLAQQRAAASLTGFEVISDCALSLVRQHFPQIPQPLPPAPWTVLLEVSDAESADHARTVFEGLLEAALESGVITDAAVASSVAQSRAMWHLRESISMAQAEEGLNIKHDIALPVSRIPAFVAQTDAALQQAFPGVRLVNFGHLGDGNLHYNVQGPLGVSAADFLARHEPAVNALVYDAVLAHGGSISAEHGIGLLKCETLEERKSPVALGLMRAIKQALDPDQRMNPGRMLARRPGDGVTAAAP